jgi:hypothetical protein
MSLSDKLKLVVLEDIKEMRVLFINNYARENGTIIKQLYEQEIINDNSIEEALEKAVFKQARTDYKIMINKSSGPLYMYADHVGRTDCLAYALEHNQFTDKEIKNIPFDHGLNIDTYVQRYGKENLLSILKEDLFNPKPLPDFGEYDPHPCCSCGQ